MIQATRSHLHVAAKSHPGMSGKNNEDRFAVTAYQLNTNRSVPAVLAIVADGIGGHRAGEVAAEIAVEAINKAVAESDNDQPVKTLGEAIIHASQVIYSQSESDVEQKGMGATCACCLIIGNRLYTAYVGDSRIYLIREDSIHQLSTDHTWIQEAIEHGALSPDEARGHPNAHVIRRYLGSRQPVVPDLRLRLRSTEDDEQAESNQGLHLLPGDQVVLCSDGLTDLVEDEEILSALKTKDQEEALDDLIDLANRRGGHDNITIVALQVPEAIPQAAFAAPTARPRRLGWACLGISALLLIGVLSVGGIFYYLNLPSVSGTPSPTLTRAAVTATLQQVFPTRTSAQTPTLTVLPPATMTPAPSRLPGTSSTPALATLTPWPTNTLAP